MTIAEHAASVDWQAMEPPAGAGFYIVRDRGGTVLYVGETDDLAERLRTHSRRRSYFSALRRHVATELLGLVLAPDVGRGFTAEDEIKISAFLATCTIAILPLSLGRWELERELVRRLRPMLNR